MVNPLKKASEWLQKIRHFHYMLLVGVDKAVRVQSQRQGKFAVRYILPSSILVCFISFFVPFLTTTSTWTIACMVFWVLGFCYCFPFVMLPLHFKKDFPEEVEAEIQILMEQKRLKSILPASSSAKKASRL